LILIIFTFLGALALSGASAYYSIVGLMSTFAGSSTAILVMAASMEYGKIVTVAWLHHNWNVGNVLVRNTLVMFTLVLMIITSMGIFGFLTKSYLTSSSDIKAVYIERDHIKEQISYIDNSIIRVENSNKQMDSAIDSLISMEKITKGLEARNSQKKERENLKEELDTLTKQKTELASSLSKINKEISLHEVDVGPIRFIAELIYGKEGGADNIESSVKIVTMMLIFVFDPLAIGLLIASQISFTEWRRKRKHPTTSITKKKPKQKNKFVSLKDIVSRSKIDHTDFERVIPETGSYEERVTNKQNRHSGKNSNSM
jgi:hypothetical protein